MKDPFVNAQNQSTAQLIREKLDPLWVGEFMFFEFVFDRNDSFSQKRALFRALISSAAKREHKGRKYITKTDDARRDGIWIKRIK